MFQEPTSSPVLTCTATNRLTGLCCIQHRWGGDCGAAWILNWIQNTICHIQHVWGGNCGTIFIPLFYVTPQSLLWGYSDLSNHCHSSEEHCITLGWPGGLLLILFTTVIPAEGVKSSGVLSIVGSVVPLSFVVPLPTILSSSRTTGGRSVYFFPPI